MPRSQVAMTWTDKQVQTDQDLYALQQLYRGFNASTRDVVRFAALAEIITEEERVRYLARLEELGL